MSKNKTVTQQFREDNISSYGPSLFDPVDAGVFLIWLAIFGFVVGVSAMIFL